MLTFEFFKPYLRERSGEDVAELALQAVSLPAHAIVTELVVWPEQRNFKMFSEWDLARVAQFANAAGALAITKQGPMEGAPTIREINQLSDL